MKKYSNNNMFAKSTSSIGDASMRFNKRQTFGNGPNNNSGVTRYPHLNQSSYQQYTPHRNNVIETYQPSLNQFKSNSRIAYGQCLPIAQNHAMQSKAIPPPLYTHKSGPASSLSQSLSSFSPNTPNTSKPPPQIQKSAKISTPPPITNNNHQQQLKQQQQPTQHVAQNHLDSSSYYYSSFYSPYNTATMAPASAPTFSMPDAMNPYMWQTITSTPPPPATLQTQQVQLTLPPPPLPQQQPPPPPKLPPLPSGEKSSTLQPPPPLPILLMDTASTPKDNIQKKSYEKNTGNKLIP